MKNPFSLSTLFKIHHNDFVKASSKGKTDNRSRRCLFEFETYLAFGCDIINNFAKINPLNVLAKGEQIVYEVLL